MAIDTPAKRFAVMNMATPWILPLPIPQGAYDRLGRFHLMNLYVPAEFVFRVMATAGPDYTYPLDRQHYTLPQDDQHYQLPHDRQHYTITRN